MEHITNCHGEWNALLGFISTLPFVGMWIKLKLGGNKCLKTKIK